MTQVWTRIQQLAHDIENQFKASGEQYFESESSYDWYNKLYSSSRYRRAHIEIVEMIKEQEREEDEEYDKYMKGLLHDYNIFVISTSIFGEK
jgi:hypothetical protein